LHYFPYHFNFICGADHSSAQKKVRKSDEELYAEWKGKFGEEGANVIRDTVAASLDDYNYLKQFALKV
jgi:hypothetical protein